MRRRLGRVSLLSGLRSVLWFAPLYGVATIGYGAISMACSRWDQGGARQHRIARAWARMLLRIAGVRVTVEGLEHLRQDGPTAQAGLGRTRSPAQPSKSGARGGTTCRNERTQGPTPNMVMVCNHLSYMDVPVLFATLPVQFRILAKAGLFKIPFLGGHLKRAQHLPVDQSSVRASMRSLQLAAASVAGGLPLFVFPEAGRSFSGALQAFVPGAFFVALQAQIPVVPMVLLGTFERLPPGTAHLTPGAVKLIIGPPVATTGLDRRQAPELAAQVRGWMEQELRRHTEVED